MADDMLFATLDPTMRLLRAAARRQGDPVRHGRLHLRPADHAGLGLPRDARGGGLGRRDPARARHRARGQRGAERRRRRDPARTRRRCRRQASASSRSGTSSTCSTQSRARRLLDWPRSAAPRAAGGRSALTGEGVDRLLAAIEERLAAARSVTLDDRRSSRADGQRAPLALREYARSWSAATARTGSVHLTVRVAPDKMERVSQRSRRRRRERRGARLGEGSARRAAR